MAISRDHLADYAAVFLVTVAGLLLRTTGLNADLWSDEVATLELIRQPVTDLMLYPRDETPFLFYALQKWLLFHASTPADVRLLACSLGAASIPAIYVAGRVAFGRSVGIIASVLLAFWPLHVQFSQEARAHTLLFLLVLLSFAGLCAWLKHDRGPDGSTVGRRLALASFGLFGVLSFYAHLLSIFWIAVAGSVFLLRLCKLQPGTLRREAILCLALVAAGAAPGLHWLWLRLADGHEYHWLTQAPPLQAGGILAGSVLPPLGVAAREAWLGGGDASLAALAAMLLLAGSAVALILPGMPDVLRSLRRNPAAAGLAVALAFIPLILWLVGFLYVPLLYSRNIVWAASGPVLVWAVAIGAVRSRVRRTAALAALVGALLLSLSRTGMTPPRPNFTLASRTAAELVRPGDAIIFCPAGTHRPFAYAATSPIQVPVLGMTTRGAILMSLGLGERIQRRVPGPIPSVGDVASIGLPQRTVWMIRESHRCDDGEMQLAAATAGVGRWALRWREGQLEILVGERDGPAQPVRPR